MSRHPLLDEQISRHLGDGLGQLSHQTVQELLDTIDAIYKRSDLEHRAIEETLLNLTHELNDSNDHMSLELEVRLKTEQALQQEKAEQAELIRKLEEAHHQLLQSEKMASIGQLAAGVAHEINNPIGFVNSNLSALRGYLADLLRVIDAYESEETALSPDVRQRLVGLRESLDLDYLRDDALALLDESTDGVRRVRQIVQDLKDFSHVDDAQWIWADLRKGLDSTLNIVNNEIKYVADVVKEYDDIPDIECLPSQLNQVFLNMFVNACHAISGKRGTITVRTGRLGDEGIFVEIADDGSGMDPQILNRIFDPFFTTKPVGQGTGLGLSLSYGIVKKHGGRIDVASEIGQGTTFRVVLPIRPPQEAQATHD
jgi:signal transduction histidine kinase